MHLAKPNGPHGCGTLRPAGHHRAAAFPHRSARYAAAAALSFVGLLALAPAVFLILQVTRYWVDVPFADEWSISVIFDRYFNGELDWDTLSAQHNESRKVFPRLIILGLGLLSRFDVRWEICVILLLAALISMNLFLMLRAMPQCSRPGRFILFTICNLILFSPAQWINWLSGIQMVVFIPPLMLTSGLLLIASEARLWQKTLGAMGLSFIATFSYANGMLLWLLLCPPALAGVRLRSHRPAKSLVLQRLCYATAFLTTLLLYFHDYHRPHQSPPMRMALQDPVRALHFLLMWVGGPLTSEGSRHSAAVACIVGATVLAAFLGALIIHWRQRTLHLNYPYVVVGLYSLFSGLVTTAGRVGAGVYAARVSRYTSFSLYLLVATVVLAWRLRPWRFDWAAVLRAGLIAGVLFLQRDATVDSMRMMRGFSRNLQNGRLALQLHQVCMDSAKLQFLYPDPWYAVSRFRSLRRHGMLNFFSEDQLRFAESKSVTEPGGIGCGDLERCRRIKPDVVEFSGWAYLAPQKRPATNVILVWRDHGGRDHPFALSGIQPGRRDIASMLGKPDGFPCAFTGTARLPHSRPGRVIVSAWTVDTDEGVAYTLEGKHAVRAGQTWKDTEGEAAPKKEGY